MILVLATGNQGKAKEIKMILDGKVDVELKTLADFPELKLPPETGRTYRENAIEKALYVATETGHLAMGDDSGLEVEALEGAPGLYSARYAGEDVSERDNRKKLIQALGDLSEEKRSAKFVCTIALVSPQSTVDVVEGVCFGRITSVETGEGGFGYDPIFFYPPLGRTFSELSPDEKNKHSHRAQALKAAIPILNEMSCQKV